MDWTEPWWHIALKRPDLAAAHEREHRAELAADHPLFGIPVAAIAKHDESDDLLFQLLDETGRVAVVHLTWARRPEHLPWPYFDLYSELDAFAEQRMRPDQEEFRARRSVSPNPPRGTLSLDFKQEADGRLSPMACLVVVRSVPMRFDTCPSHHEAYVGTIPYVGGVIGMGPRQTVFGRSPSGLQTSFPDAAVVYLPSAEVKRQHALIAHTHDGWTIEGWMPLTLTSINGRLVGRERSPLHDHDTIELGRFVFIFRDLSAVRPAGPL
jgi:hypothetical protein